jgi:hypothetical protein
MFVPTHIRKDAPYMITVKNGGSAHFISESGWMTTTTALHHYEPITLPCPYCGATLNQSERVECECGWTAEAISESMLEALIMPDSLAYCKSSNEIFNKYIADRNGDLLKVYSIYHVNDIYWLEITPGKEKNNE